MTKQDNILAKYNSLNSGDQTRGFITLPRKFISLELPANEKGLFIQLLLNAGVSPVQDYHYVLKNQTVNTLVRMVFWKKGNKRINSVHTRQLQELLEKLKADKLIKISEYQDDRFDIVLPTAKKLREGNDGFIKLYGDSLNKIVSQSTGIKRLKNLLFYAAVRSRVYENYQQQEIINDSPKYFAKILKSAESTARNSLGWLRDNKVLAYYKAELLIASGNERYYYADMHDAHILTDVVKGYLGQGLIKRVLE